MKRTQREIAERIEELERLLESGVSSVSTDGTSTTFDLQSARRELDRLRNEYAGRPRRRSRRINGSTF